MWRAFWSWLTGKSYAAAGRSPKWSKVREEYLKRFPTCAACGGRRQLNVHHKLPFSWPGGKERELDPSNFITLCEGDSMNCHLWIGHLGDWQSRNYDVDENAAAMLVKIKTRPYPGVEA